MPELVATLGITSWLRCWLRDYSECGLTGVAQTAELWNAPRHSLRSCPARSIIGSAAAELLSVSWPIQVSIPMQAKPVPSNPRFLSLMEWAFVIVFGGLLAYALIAWLELHPSVRVHNPPGFVFLTIGMFLQPVSSLMRRRSRVASYTLLATSMVFLVAAIRTIAS